MFGIRRDFYENGKIVRIFHFNLEPMSHDEACVFLGKLMHSDKWFDRLVVCK